MSRSQIDYMLGCLYGQAIGDALGLGTEFMTKDVVKRIYPSGLKTYDQILQDEHRSCWSIGAWTDDTDMMLCIMDAYSQGTINPAIVAFNFKEWYNGTPLGIGCHTNKVLGFVDYEKYPEQFSRLIWELSGKQAAANGALMRTSVIGLLQDDYIDITEKVCLLTHYDSRCVGSCVIMTSIIHNLIWKKKELSVNEIIEIGNLYDDRIKEWIDLAYSSEDISALQLDETYSIGYTLRSLAAALWCYFHAPDFEKGLITIVNEGGDADTNAAIACAILGAKYGYSSIPQYYIDNLHNENYYLHKVESFIKLLLKEAEG